MGIALATEMPNITARRKWTRMEYDRLIDMGMIDENEPVELIGGEIVAKMSPQKSKHAFGVGAAHKALSAAYGPGFHVRSQLPLAVSSDSEPEPDAAVVRGDIRDFVSQHPSTAVLVVEVSDSTLAFDRTEKAGLYASVGIPEYWLINLIDNVLEVRSQPEADASAPFGFGYASVVSMGADGALRPPYARTDVRVADLLP